jgi:hypothetical protein
MPPALTSAATESSRRSHHGFLPLLRRLSVLAGHTFTQLVRMKVFYFLLVFSLLMFVAGFVLSSVSPDAELKLVKDTGFGVMQVFSALFGIVGMALLLPKDIEDRTLYTILSKPVRRFEYLLGKYFGVLLVLLVCLIFMDIMSSIILHIKYKLAVSDEISGIQQLFEQGKYSQNEFAAIRDEATAKLSAQGLRWEMHLAVVAIFLKSAVITAVAMAVSTFAGSTIFTMMATLCIYIIGHLQSSARETMLAPPPSHGQIHAAAGNPNAVPLAEPPGVALRIASGAVAVLFPDFQVYNVVDAVVGGNAISFSDVLKMLGLSVMYLAIYLTVSIFLFAEKEL